MKAILLAGGKGTRISKNINEMPKCCLPIGGVPLINIIVRFLLSKKIDVAVCVGYKDQEVREALKGLKVVFYYNPFYEVTNSLGTLWFAKEFIKNDDILIMNADVYFESKILDLLISSKNSCVIAADSSKCLTGDYYFMTNETGRILKYGKDLPKHERTHEYVGIAFLRKSFVPAFIKKFDELIEKGQYNLWWENVLYCLSENNLDIYVVDCAGIFWSEVDFYEEYIEILEYTKKGAL